ncbi:hypothetical protein Sm713_05900 [Streptomyces sp. TS71-3]|nr:hypothetical protein Sm713_05900 [Streptomyces sp. TS71-3]
MPYKGRGELRNTPTSRQPGTNPQQTPPHKGRGELRKHPHQPAANNEPATHSPRWPSAGACARGGAAKPPDPGPPAHQQRTRTGPPAAPGPTRKAECDVHESQ